MVTINELNLEHVHIVHDITFTCVYPANYTAVSSILCIIVYLCYIDNLLKPIIMVKCRQTDNTLQDLTTSSYVTAMYS